MQKGNLYPNVYPNVPPSAPPCAQVIICQRKYFLSS